MKKYFFSKPALMNIHTTHHIYKIAVRKKWVWKFFFVRDFSSAAPILMDVANLRDGLDYQEEVPNDCSDESDGCASDEYYMINSDSEENMTKDSDDG